MVCEAFGCMPRQARRESWADVEAVMEYRMAKHALSVFNEGGEALKEFEAQPAFAALLMEMRRAQEG